MGSTGKVACAYDNSLMESSFGSMQIEPMGRSDWATRAELVNGISEWIEAFHNPTRRHSSIGYVSSIEFETRHTAAENAA